MTFSTNYTENPNLIPAGTYETVIRSAKETYTKGGTLHIELALVVRNDVDQPQKDRFIYTQIWKKKVPTLDDMKSNGYTFKLQQISRLAGIPNGKSFATFDEWLHELEGKPLCVTVEHQTYEGNLYARVIEEHETAFPDVKHVFPSILSTPDADMNAETKFTDVDDDLPF